MKITTTHYETCKEAWIYCHGVLNSVLQHNISFSERTRTVLDECASICLGTLEALKAEWDNINTLAILTVGICEECAEVCERYNDSVFHICAQKCRECSAAFSSLVTYE